MLESLPRRHAVVGVPPQTSWEDEEDSAQHNTRRMVFVHSSCRCNAQKEQEPAVLCVWMLIKGHAVRVCTSTHL